MARKPRPKLRHTVALAMAAAALALAAAPAHSQAASEYQAKAAFLYNFTKFVDWPPRAFASPTAPINVCVLGEEYFGASLDAIQERQAQGRPLTVKRLASIGQAGTCHILFIGASEDKQVRSLLAAVKGQPVLTVGETDRFAEMGGVINLVLEDKRIKMEVNLDAAQRHGLKISSQLLRLARVVGGES